MLEYFAVYKPFGMLSQFSKDGDQSTLADLGNFNNDVYPVGRLDKDSEGLLILTNDKSLNAQLLQPQNGHERKYLVQVDGSITKEAIERLRDGVNFRSKGKVYHSKPAHAKLIEEPELSDRVPPVRYRKNIPTSWIELTLSEGKNRQVRKMTAAVGFPTLRLVRRSIEDLTIQQMKPAEVVSLSRVELWKKLNL